MRIRARRYDNRQLVELDLAGGRIRSLSSIPDDGFPAERTPAWIAPGLVDLQVNGFGGQEFIDPELTVEKVRDVCLAMDSMGVTTFLPTATTHGRPLLTHVLSTIAEACRRHPEVACRVGGIHLEGPYLSAEDGPRGAHPRQHCRPPDWDEFRRLQDAAEGGIVVLTMSPEFDGAARFVRQVADSGVLVAIGHTAADSDQIQAAVEAGARMSTHLGNGAHGQIRRHPNYIWDQLAEDRLTAGLIVDGHHLPAEVVKCFVRAKTPERCVLVSDVTGIAGLPPGRYHSPSLADVEVLEDGRLVVAGQRQYLAGAALPLTAGVANVMSFADVDLKTAIDMASERPATLIRRDPVVLGEGSRADLFLFRIRAGDRPSLTVSATFKDGELVFGRTEDMRDGVDERA